LIAACSGCGWSLLIAMAPEICASVEVPLGHGTVWSRVTLVPGIEIQARTRDITGVRWVAYGPSWWRVPPCRG